MKRSTSAVSLAAFAAVVSAGAAAATAAPQFTGLVDFGDSLSDVGNDYNTTTGLGLPALPGKPGYYNGHFSNGPIWIEQLAPKLGLPVPTASTAGGTDYAYGGVTTGTGTTDGLLPNIRTQINGYTATHAASASQLFTLLGGANDLFADLTTVTTPMPTSAQLAVAAAAADNISGDAGVLYGDGARNILLPNLPDLGLIPDYRGTSQQAAATALTQAFNAELASDLTTLSSASAGLTVYRVDLFTQTTLAINNPFAYGLTNVTDSAYTGDTTYAGNGTAVSNPAGYLYWDGVHPTTTGHGLIAQDALAALTAVPEPATAAVLAAALPLAARRKRRA